jgi:hypothetical protein
MKHTPPVFRGAIGSLGLATSPLSQRRGLLCNTMHAPDTMKLQGVNASKWAGCHVLISVNLSGSTDHKDADQAQVR